MGNKSTLIKPYRVVRTVEEVYYVEATSRQAAVAMYKDNPMEITVIREKATMTYFKEKGGKNG